MAISLKDLIANHVRVDVGDGEEDYVKVYGLTLTDVAYFARNYSDTLAKLVDSKSDEPIDWKALLLEAPEFCVEVLSRCTREDVEIVKGIAMGLQLELLGAAWEATSIDPSMIETAVKKCLGLLSNLNKQLG